MAHLYTDAQSLLIAVERFVFAALDRGEAAVVIATADHVNGLRERLEKAGRNWNALADGGQLLCIDAHATIHEIVNDREADREAFDRVVGSLITSARRRFHGLCVYGELVNVLWRDSNMAAAERIEQWWNELIEQHEFRLLCSFHVNVFDERSQAALDSICRTHSHLLPVADSERFDQAVNAALLETFPHSDVDAMGRTLVERCRHSTRMPRGQAALFALRDLLPTLAHDVRLRAQRHYHRQWHSEANNNMDG